MLIEKNSLNKASFTASLLMTCCHNYSALRRSTWIVHFQKIHSVDDFWSIHFIKCRSQRILRYVYVSSAPDNIIYLKDQERIINHWLLIHTVDYGVCGTQGWCENIKACEAAMLLICFCKHIIGGKFSQHNGKDSFWSHCLRSSQRLHSVFVILYFRSHQLFKAVISHVRFP